MKCPLDNANMTEVVPGVLYKCPYCRHYKLVHGRRKPKEVEGYSGPTCRYCGAPLSYKVEIERGYCMDCWARAAGVSEQGLQKRGKRLM